jgi:hypothetical protein
VRAMRNDGRPDEPTVAETRLTWTRPRVSMVPVPRVTRNGGNVTGDGISSCSS